MSTSVKVERVSITRETVPVKDDASDTVAELAIGDTTARAFVRGPSGKLYVISIPGEMADELQSYM